MENAENRVIEFNCNYCSGFLDDGCGGNIKTLETNTKTKVFEKLRGEQNSSETDIINAILKGEFCFLSQGIFNIHGDKKKQEFLSRIKLDNQIITPDKFIPVIRKYGYKTYFDHKVIEKFFSMYDNQSNVSVNINPSTFINDIFLKDLENLIKYYNINAEKIILEILETENIKDYKSLNAVIEKLKKMGFSIALDDFHPIGNNNIGSIKNIHNLDIIKFDRHYIRNIVDTKTEQDNIKHILDVIFSINPQSDIVFEGIENKEFFEYCKSIDGRINLFQGYYFDKGSLILPKKDLLYLK